MVAPVIQEGAFNRTVYLPQGRWVDGNSGEVYDGPHSIVEYSAPIEVLPYFVREGSEALRLLQGPL